MDEVLLKKIAQYVESQQKIPTSISGYSNDDVSTIVQDMIDKKVITHGKVTKFSPGYGNYTITTGSAIPLGSKEEIDMVMLSEYDFEKIYGITWY